MAALWYSKWAVLKKSYQVLAPRRLRAAGRVPSLSLMTENRHQQAARDSDFLKILAGRTRILLLRELFDGQRSVKELAAAIGTLDTAVSQQLALLKAAGLVSSRREGQRIFYSLVSDNARQLLEAVRAMATKREVEVAG